MMRENVYEAPESEVLVSKEPKRRETLGKILSIIGSILQFGIVYGVLAFIVEMVMTFQAITLYGEGDPKVMAGEISAALVNIILGGIVALHGFFINLLALYISSYRSALLFSYLIFISIFWIITFPIGTLIGIVLLVITIKKRRVFRTKLLVDK